VASGFVAKSFARAAAGHAGDDQAGEVLGDLEVKDPSATSGAHRF
jgi:hypothetical protein